MARIRTSKRWEPSVLLLAPLIVLLTASAYELAFALKLFSVGTSPGEGPAGNDAAVVASLFAMLSGAALSVALDLRPSTLLACLAPASAAFVAARFYTFDPYYAPNMRRLSDGGAVPMAWIFGLVFMAVLAGFSSRIWPSIGSGLTAAVVLLCAVTVVWQLAGH